MTKLATVEDMKTVTIRDFRTRPKQVREELSGDGGAVLTVNGQAFALLIPVDDDNLQDALDAFHRSRGLLALQALRRESRARGLDKMSAQEIDELIRETRGSREG